MSSSSAPVALVTGGTKRIGAAIVGALHDRGYRIAIHFGQSRQAAVALRDELNHKRPDSADIFQADLCKSDDIEAMASAVVARWGQLDALVNNASSFYPTPFAESTEQAWDDLMGSNLKGPYFLTLQLAPELRRQKGAVVNITDINIRYPLRDYPVYCIAKAGKAMLTRSLALELAPEVRVNSVAPGSIMWPEGAATMSEAEKAATLAKIPLNRTGSPADIAHLVTFLVTSGSYITGQVIAVDGGINLSGSKY